MATKATRQTRSIGRPPAASRGSGGGRASGSAQRGEPWSDAQIVDTPIDAIIATDEKGRIKRWNDGAEALYGYSAEEVLGRAVGLILPPGRPTEHQELFRRVLAGERIEHYRTVRRRKDGSTVNVSLTLFALVDGAGE